MAHVRPHQVSGGQRRTQRELAGKYTSSDDLGELTCVLAWACGVRAAYAKHVEHSGLWFEDGAATDGADFYAGHGDGDLEVAVETAKVVSGVRNEVEVGHAYFFMTVMQLLLSTFCAGS